MIEGMGIIMYWRKDKGQVLNSVPFSLHNCLLGEG